MITPKDVTQKDAAVMAKIAVKDDQYCPETKEQLQVLIKYPDIPLDAINTADITDMSRLFEKSKRKDFAGINTWDTSAVTDMSYMFAGCERFNEELGADIPATSLVGKLLKRSAKSRFDTSKVKTMAHMFEDCVDFNKPLKLNTANCEDFSCFLKKCKDFNSSVEIDTRSAVNMNRMFEACISFNQALNLDTKNVKNMSYMFRHCRAFNQALNFDTSACENFNAFLVSCTQFNQPLSFDTSKAKKLNLMFEKCVNLDAAMEFDLSAAEDISRMFSECTRLTKTPILKNLDNVNKAEDVFKKCDKLSEVPDMSAYNKATEASVGKSSGGASDGEKKYHPKDRDELIELINDLSVHLGDIDTSAITDMSSLVGWSCERTDWSGIGEWDTSNATDMCRMLSRAKNFNEKLAWDTSKVTDMREMFEYAEDLEHYPEFDTSNADTLDMFRGTEKLLKRVETKINGKYKPQNRDELQFLIDKADINLAEIDTSAVTDMRSLYFRCEDLSGIDTWDTSNVTDMTDMFSGNVKDLDYVPPFDMSKVTKKDGMFDRCPKVFIQLIAQKDGKYYPKDNKELKFLINKSDVKLSNVDTSAIDDFSFLIDCRDRTDWSGIGEWDTSNATTMKYMLSDAKNFNEPLNWDTSKVTNMKGMFSGCSSFNQAINFDFSKVEDVKYMFENCDNLMHKPNMSDELLAQSGWYPKVVNPSDFKDHEVILRFEDIGFSEWHVLCDEDIDEEDSDGESYRKLYEDGQYKYLSLELFGSYGGNGSIYNNEPYLDCECEINGESQEIQIDIAISGEDRNNEYQPKKEYLVARSYEQLSAEYSLKSLNEAGEIDPDKIIALGYRSSYAGEEEYFCELDFIYLSETNYHKFMSKLSFDKEEFKKKFGAMPADVSKEMHKAAFMWAYSQDTNHDPLCGLFKMDCEDEEFDSSHVEVNLYTLD